jgi:hypothetical protein
VGLSSIGPTGPTLSRKSMRPSNVMPYGALMLAARMTLPQTRAVPISLAYSRYRRCCGPTACRSNELNRRE